MITSDLISGRFMREARIVFGRSFTKPGNLEPWTVPLSDGFSEEDMPNREFVFDLDAALRFKTFLNGRAIDIPEETISSLAELEQRYSYFLRDYSNWLMYRAGKR